MKADALDYGFKDASIETGRQACLVQDRQDIKSDDDASRAQLVASLDGAEKRATRTRRGACR